MYDSRFAATVTFAVFCVDRSIGTPEKVYKCTYREDIKKSAHNGNLPMMAICGSPRAAKKPGQRNRYYSACLWETPHAASSVTGELTHPRNLYPNTVLEGCAALFHLPTSSHVIRQQPPTILTAPPTSDLCPLPAGLSSARSKIRAFRPVRREQVC